MRRTPQKIERRRLPAGATRHSPGFSVWGGHLIVAALCLMVVLVPLALWQGLYEHELLPKRLVLHVGIAVSALGWILQTRWGREVHTPSWRVLLPCICWMAACALSSAATTHPLDALLELANQAALVVLFLVAASALPLSRLGPVWWAAVLTGLATALAGILQYHGIAFLDIPTNAPPSATFANRNLAAEYLICVIPLSWWLFLETRRRAGEVLAGLATSLMLVFLIYTRTRSAWVGLAAALGVLAGLAMLRPALRPALLAAAGVGMDRPRRRLALALALLAASLAALPPYTSGFQAQGMNLPGAKAGVGATASSIFKGDVEKDAGIRERLVFWRATLRMVLDRPLLGAGPGGWIRAYPPYDGGATITPQGYHRRPHNDYLWIASENGLIGLGTYLWFLTMAFLWLWRMAVSPDDRARRIASPFAASLLALLIAAFFGFPKDQPATTLFPFLLLGLIAGTASQEREGPATPGSPTRHAPHGVRNGPLKPAGRALWTFGAVPYLCGVVALGAVEMTRRRIAFDRHYYVAFSWCLAGKGWEKVLSEAEAATRYGDFLPDILFFKGLALQNLGRVPEAEVSFRQTLAYAPHAWYAHEGLGLACLQRDLFQDALTHLRNALALCPATVYNRNNIGVVYQRMGRMDLAEAEFRAALKADPDNPETCLNLGSIYRLRGQLDTAAVHYRHALRSNPDMPQARINLAQVLLLKGGYLEALALFQAALRASAADPDAQWGAGLALEGMGRSHEAEAAYRRVVTLQPGFAQAHLALASLVFAQGRYPEALGAYQSFLRLGSPDTAAVRLARAQILLCEGRMGR